MDLSEPALAAWEQVRAHKLRSALTSLGIIIGITAITAVMAVVEGLGQGFDEFVDSFSPDVVYVERLPRMVDPGEDLWRLAKRRPLAPGLAEALKQRSRYLVAVTAEVEAQAAVQREAVALRAVAVSGVNAAFAEVHPVRLSAGRFFVPAEERSRKRVCVLSAQAGEELFGSEEPVGQDVRVGAKRFRVVGVLEPALGRKEHEARVYIPVSTFGVLFGLRGRDASIQARAVSAGAVDRAADEVTGLVRASRRLDALEDEDFDVFVQEELRAQVAPVKRVLLGVGLFLTALSLVVGGLGVTNIMYVSVRERTSEIGLRKAVGATSSEVLSQFLIESVLVCCVGGAIGVACGAAACAAVGVLLPAPFPPQALLIALATCVVVGVAAGLAPAWAAARVDPIEALRHV